MEIIVKYCGISQRKQHRHSQTQLKISIRLGMGTKRVRVFSCQK